MARVSCVLGAIILWALVQAEDVITRNGQPAIIEDLRSAPDTRIVSGWAAEDGQIPYHVSVRMVSGTGGVGGCGGSLIHHNWVITAAHCLANRYTFVVRVGVTNLTRPEWLLETLDKVIHPGYDLTGPGVQSDDVALLRLNQHIPYGPTIQPIRLQNSEQKNATYQGAVLTVSGYGRRDDPVNGGEWSVSNILLWVYLRGITNDECLEWYTNSTVISDQTVCAQYYNDTSQSPCQGDSGGPLTMADLDGAPTMVGIASFVSTAGCNSPYPSGFVRPGYYHDWYREVTGVDFDWKVEDLNSAAPHFSFNLVYIILPVLFTFLSV